MEAELDKIIGCDFKRIPDVLKRLHVHKNELENKVGYYIYVPINFLPYYPLMLGMDV